MTELFSEPNAQMHGGPCGIENLQNDHWLVKYFVNKLDDSLPLGSSRLNTWIVPWSDETTTAVDAWLKLMQ